MENSPMQPEDEVSRMWKTTGTQQPNKSLDQKYWKKIFIFSCLCSVLVDPLFLYVPILKDDIKCLMLDPKLKIVVLLLKSLPDFFYLMDIFIRIYRSENYSGLIVELNRRQHSIDFNFVLKSFVPRIAKAIWTSYDILTDIAAVLPLPHVAILIFFSKMSDLRFLTTTTMVIMNIFALFQYVPRVLRIYLSFKELQKIHLEEEIRETPIWIKGVLNFFLYIIASHVVGALWYFFAIQRMMICWHSACQKKDGCDNRMFGCHDHHFFRNTTILNDLCPVNVGDNSLDTMFFDFGIFATVLKYGVVGSTSFFKKLLKCFCWGLRNLSSFGSNLETSADVWENLYTAFISISGLLLFLYLIGNLQMYMQFETTRRENRKRKMVIKQKMEEKDRDIELWLFKRGVPTKLNKDMKLRIMKKVQQALEENMKINLDNILHLLPSDVQSRIADCMPLAKLKEVPMLQGIDDDLLKRICQKLIEHVRYTDNSIIIQKGEILEKMFYIVDGVVSVEEISSDDKRRGVGELCGQELLRRPFSSDFPYREQLATESVKAIGVVEALALHIRDLDSIYGQSDIKRKEEPRHRKMMKKEVEQHMNSWMRKGGIPERENKSMKLRIMENLSFDHDYWDTLPSDWFNLVSRLPLDFQNEIKSYMPLTKLKKMPVFQNMEESVLKQICSRLWPKKCDFEDGDVIARGDPVQMLFVVDGYISDQSFNEKGPQEIYGEELLLWPFLTSFPRGVPTTAESPYPSFESTEVLVLTARNMESVATKFRKHFIKNYGRLVHKLDGPYFSNFREREIKEATRNYACLNYPNEGGHGTVYHTELDGRAVAIKMYSATGDPFIHSRRLVNEAVVLSEIRHTNVESLVGCCLATRWPIMVYDRTDALTLVEHLHRNRSELSLESRMKIAAETAGTLAHVHSRSVVHRDVKTANIKTLIDHTTHTVKVTGFGASRLLGEDEGEMEDEVSALPGTSGYLDPEYLETHVLTEKSDVYSFGVVLAELLTRQEAVSSDGPERSLADDFVRSVNDNRLDQILDDEIKRDRFSFEIAEKVSKLVEKCLSSRGQERPFMNEVAAVLERVVQTIRNGVEPSTVDDNISSSV